MKKICGFSLCFVLFFHFFCSAALASVGSNVAWRDAEKFLLFDGSSFLQAVWERESATLYLRLTLVMDSLRQPSSQGAGLSVIFYKNNELHEVESRSGEALVYEEGLFTVEREESHFSEQGAFQLTLKIQLLKPGGWPEYFTYDAVALGPDGNGSRGVSQKQLRLEPPTTVKPSNPPKTTKEKTTKAKTTKAKTTKKSTTKRKTATVRNRKASEKQGESEAVSEVTDGTLLVDSPSPMKNYNLKLLLGIIAIAVLLAALYSIITLKKRKETAEENEKEED